MPGRTCSIAMVVASVALLAGKIIPVRPADDSASSNDLKKLIGALIDGRDETLGTLTHADRVELHELYQPDDSPVWLDSDRPTRNAHDALDLLGHAADDGLNPSDYNQDVLGTLVAR